MYQGTLEAISNRQTWTDSITVTDDNGAALNIAGASVSIAVRDQQCKTIVLSGTNTDGHVTFPGGGTDGVFSWTFSSTEVRALCAKSYDVGITITIAGVVSQLIIMTLPVLDGIVA